MTAGRSRSAGYGRGYRGRKWYISWRIESGWRKTETMCGRMELHIANCAIQAEQQILQRVHDLEDLEWVILRAVSCSKL